MPKVSIGVPVYNGSPYIRDSLQNLCDQTFKDFEVIISDNCSEDDTADICREFCEKDSRFRYIRQSENIGMVRNFEFVLREAKSEYFCWRSYDDYADLDYIEFLSNVLDRSPRATLAVSESVWYDYENNYEKTFKVNPTVGASRISALKKLLIRCAGPWFYGLYRREQLIPHWEYSRDNIGFFGHNSDILTIGRLVVEEAVVAESGSKVHLQRFKWRDLGENYHSIENRVRSLKLAKDHLWPSLKKVNVNPIDKLVLYVLFARFLDKKIVRIKPLLKDMLKRKFA
ncbi:glycosyltransferase family 2 protein [Labrys sp. ZIDIC5]|uniref:glycosyltransferase family 2 protein n=1 Tax=Labrys sedimenti TaxID=3106036 RepID=UPI002ACAE54D|nr:glycosyltransferase family 2 protein [Labrys sp. ZIDIC5]MDZ5448979.1 glycosyltransferase family 2 protein [Labrys sp. ZIDIC5]